MGMRNAKGEFLNHISDRELLCAQIYERVTYGEKPKFINLTTGWTNEDWNQFTSDLDFEYDSGYGGQNLFGTIWYVDGTWSSRGEYDGSEWWDHHQCPTIPPDLNRVDNVRDKKINQIL